MKIHIVQRICFSEAQKNLNQTISFDVNLNKYILYLDPLRFNIQTTCNIELGYGIQPLWWTTTGSSIRKLPIYQREQEIGMPQPVIIR